MVSQLVGRVLQQPGLKTYCVAKPMTSSMNPPRATPAAQLATPPAIAVAKAPTPIILITFLTAAAVE